MRSAMAPVPGARSQVCVAAAAPPPHDLEAVVLSFWRNGSGAESREGASVRPYFAYAYTYNTHYVQVTTD